jgi:hypothetical protein
VRQSSPLSFADMNHAQELLAGDTVWCGDCANYLGLSE